MAATEQSRVPRIGIFGHVGNQNLGDEAIIAAVIQNIRERVPDVDITGFTIRPDDTRARHNISAFPIRRGGVIGEEHAASASAAGTDTGGFRRRIKLMLGRVAVLYRLLTRVRDLASTLAAAVAELRFLGQSYKRVRKVDLLLMAGSGQITDFFGGTWGFPFTIFKWTVLARCAGVKVAFLNVGAGPIKSRTSRFLLRTSLRLASYKSFRDISSKQLVEGIGVRGENPVVPDLAYSLGPYWRETGPRRPTQRVVGINPIPYFDHRYWPEHDPAVYADYVQKMAGWAKWLIEAGDEVILFPTQLRADPPVIADVERLLRSEVTLDAGQRVSTASVANFDELVTVLRRTDVVCAARFHGVLISYLVGKPVVGVAYHPKTLDLMAAVGESSFGVNIANLNLDELKARFILLAADLGASRKRIMRGVTAHKHALAEQYERILALLGPRTSKGKGDVPASTVASARH
jgi:polysaccharide pyruvyl transferase WcaK-like protein